MIASAYSQLADVYTRLSIYDSAIDYAYKSLSIFQKKDNKLFMAYNYSNIADIYSQEESMLPKSLELYKKAYQIYIQIGDSSEIGGALLNIAFAYSQMNKYDSAKNIFLKAIEINRKTKQNKYLIASYDNLARLYGNFAKYELALAYYHKSELMLNKLNNELFWAGHFNFVIETLENMGDWKNVLKTAQKGLKYAKKCNDKDMVDSYYQAMANALEHTGNYKECVKYLHLTDSLNMILSNKQMKDKLAEKDALYHLNSLQDKLSVIKANEKSERLTKYLLVVFIFIIAMIFSSVVLWLMKKRKKEKILYEYNTILSEKKEKLIESELERKKLNEKKLQNEIEFKTRQLTTTALNTMQKNKILNELSSLLRNTARKASPQVKKELSNISKEIEHAAKDDKDWEIFKLRFEQINPVFFDHLKNINPSLTTNDLRICAFLKLHFNIKETASILNLSPVTVKTVRYKLRKKLNLIAEDDLYEFIGNI